MRRDLETGTDSLLARVEDRLGIITFNRPERRNALCDDMYVAIAETLAAFAADDDVGAVLVTGAGGSFCAGGDVKGMHESHSAGTPHPGRPPGREAGAEFIRTNQRRVSLAMHEHPKPVIAALPGPAAGAGLSIALAADIRIAAQSALLVTAFRNVAASGDFGGSWFLTQLVGTGKARELYFTSPRLTATEAQSLGIVNQVLPDDGFAEAAIEWCRPISEGPPLALAAMKANLNRALTADVATALDAEAEAMAATMATADHREAAAAFVEKRLPTFTGR